MRRGFSLVELLTVIAVVGLIVSLSLYALGHNKARARDDQRVADLKLIQTTLELYKTDLERSDNPDDLYPYPPRFADADQGIYGNVRFASYLAKTPVDPLTKQSYIYYAPGCIKPGDGTYTNPTVIAPAKDPNFHTAEEIFAAPGGTYCPKGFGWVPYALAAIFELPRSTESTQSSAGNLGNSKEAGIYSSKPPTFGDNGKDKFVDDRYISDDRSYCFPAGACDEKDDDAGPSPTPSAINLSSPSPSPQPNTSPTPNQLTSPGPSPVPSGAWHSTGSPRPTTSPQPTSSPAASSGPTPGGSPASFQEGILDQSTGTNQ